ncbi:GNAT family N-acetyltransferase [Candidatus Pacearchaeota archaeon]|nr:GNAT family N-acetyltransferase [Candidatus Pacearchaeota archaeon]
MKRLLESWNKFVINESFREKLYRWWNKKKEADRILIEIDDGDAFGLLWIDLKSMILLFQNNKGKVKQQKKNDLKYEEGEEQKVFLPTKDMIDSGAIIGMVYAMETEAADDGKCMGAWEIKNAATTPKYRGKGLGKILFLLAAGGIASRGAPVCADRYSVSDAAIRALKGLKSLGLKQTPPKKEPFVGRFDNKENACTTTEKDDCVVYPSDEDAGGLLNKAFYVKEYIEPYKKAKKEGDDFLAMFHEVFPDINTRSYFADLLANLFDQQYIYNEKQKSEFPHGGTDENVCQLKNKEKK